MLLAECRLERRPWRLVWQCRVCQRRTRVLVEREALPVLLRMDRAGGMPVSFREWRFFANASHAAMEAALWEEVL